MSISEMLIALFFIVLGVLGLVGQKGRKDKQRGLGAMLITIGVIMLALLVEYPHRQSIFRDSVTTSDSHPPIECEGRRPGWPKGQPGLRP